MLPDYYPSGLKSIPTASRAALSAVVKKYSAEAASRAGDLSKVIVDLDSLLGPGFNPSFQFFCQLFEPSGDPKRELDTILRNAGLPTIEWPAQGAISASPPRLTFGSTFASIEQMSHFLSKLPVCSAVSPGNVLCPQPPTVLSLCRQHISLSAELTGPDRKGWRIAPLEDFTSIKIPTVEDFSAARPSFDAGKFVHFFDPHIHSPTKQKKAPTLEDPTVLPYPHTVDSADPLYLAPSNSLGASVELFASPLTRDLSWCWLPPQDARGLPHFSHIFNPRVKDIRAHSLRMAFAPPGTVRDFLRAHGDRITSLAPLTPYFARWGFGATPACSDLFGDLTSDSHWDRILQIYPRLSTFLNALSLPASEFLNILADYRQAFTTSRSIHHVQTPSIAELIFRLWADANSVEQAIISEMVNVGLHHHFLINQFMLASFDIIRDQAIEILSSLIGSETPLAFYYQASLVQAFRNFHANPGLVARIGTEISEMTNAVHLAYIDGPHSPNPCFKIDPKLKTQELLAKERTIEATNRLNKFSFMVKPPVDSILAFKTAVPAYIDQITRRLIVVPETKKSPTRKLARDHSSEPTALTSPQNTRKRQYEDQEPPDRSPHRSAKDTPPDGTIMQTIRSFVLPHIPNECQPSYLQGCGARIRGGRSSLNPDLHSKTSELASGWKGIPLYRLFPESRNIPDYCCACGRRTAGAGAHTVDSCPMRSTNRTPTDVPVVNSSLSGRSSPSRQ